MNPSFAPLLELLNGDAYCPHPADASVPLGRRFPGKAIVVIGGGGTGNGWTQRVLFGRDGTASLDGHRSPLFKRSTAEWGSHLLSEARSSSGWAVILVEQQWQAAVSRTSGASMGGGGVEQMLRVRDSVSQFGDDRISEDAVRVAIDHPMMEGSVVGGVRSVILDPLEKEAVANGFKLAAVRVGVFSLLERHFARLHAAQESPSRTVVAYDGQSALIVGIREGAFDFSEAGISYLVNRPPAEVRAQVARRISSPASLKEWSGKVEVIGTTFAFENGQFPEGIDIKQESNEVVLSVVDEAVHHDLRKELCEMRRALPRAVRPAVFAAILITCTSIVGAVAAGSEGFRLEKALSEKKAERERLAGETALSKSQLAALRREQTRAQRIGEWVDKNYHAQALLQGALTALPFEVSLDALTVQASEGLPQTKLRFTLLGSEDAQRAALRSLEAKLYQLGYEVGKRDDPILSTTRRGGVVYAWDLIIPRFGG